MELALAYNDIVGQVQKEQGRMEGNVCGANPSGKERLFIKSRHRQEGASMVGCISFSGKFLKVKFVRYIQNYNLKHLTNQRCYAGI